jgi:hypothetical protein
MWTGTASGPVSVAAAGFVATLGVVLLVVLPDARWVGVVVVIVGVIVATTVGRLRVEVGPDAFVVRLGVLGFPRRSVQWSDVSGIAVLDVVPLQWGGWGYRWLPWRRATAVVVRAGEGIRLDLRDGRTFVVTVDDARGGAEAAARRLTRGTR